MKKFILFTAIVAFIGTIQTLNAQMKSVLITQEDANKCFQKNRSSALALKELLRLSEEHVLQNIRTETDALGYSHERFEQYYKGIKIENADVRVHYKDGKFYYANGEYIDFNYFDTTKTVSHTEAITLAEKFALSILGGERKFTLGSLRIEPEIVICLNKINPLDQKPHIAYKVDIYAEEQLFHEDIYVDAKNGEILNHISNIMFDVGSADTRYSGTQLISTLKRANNYYLIDSTRGEGILTRNLNNLSAYRTIEYNFPFFKDSNNHWTAEEFHTDGKDDAALDAHWGAMKTFDYFFEKHGRKSYNDSNAAIKNYVHAGVNADNSLWFRDLKIIAYGDGDSTIGIDALTSLDIVAHEIGHAVCQYSAGLINQGESGNINESLSDIWAACGK